jgi:hypothetical protein
MCVYLIINRVLYLDYLCLPRVDGMIVRHENDFKQAMKCRKPGKSTTIVFHTGDYSVSGDSKGYEISSDGYKASSGGYKPSSGDLSADGYKSSSDGYKAPSDGYKASSDGYKTAGAGSTHYSLDFPEGPLGIQVANAGYQKLIVLRVEPGCLAEGKGVRVNDYMVRIGDQEVTTDKAAMALLAREKRPVRVTFCRDATDADLVAR